jgi:nucleoside transporter
MMFLQYFIWGAWYVTLGTWLAGALHFSGRQIGWAAGTTAIGAIISPYLVGIAADRSFATQTVLGLLHGLGALLLYAASLQSSFLSFYGTILLYSLCYMPTLALTNSLAMRQMRDPKLEFGPIRVLGTVGWIVAGLIVGGLGLESTALPMRVAAVCSLLMAAYCFTLPDTPPLAKSSDESFARLLSKETIGLLGGRSMLVFVAAALLLCIPLQFYYAFTNLFLNETGVSNAAGKMTGGQMSELVFMMLIPWFFRRWGVKYMLTAGMVAWVVRYLLFAFGNSHALVWMLWGGILLHGICYDFFFVTGQIYVDRKAPAALRAAAQGLLTLITYGAGMFAGSWLSGYVVENYTHTNAVGPAGHNWAAIWIFAAACSGVVLVLFLASFEDDAESGRADMDSVSGASLIRARHDT